MENKLKYLAILLLFSCKNKYAPVKAARAYDTVIVKCDTIWKVGYNPDVYINNSTEKVRYLKYKDTIYYIVEK